ncbi:hypothetical protein NMY22_g4101 [Coprinellus aureogranulatus]|nr:hypothetical protein NMY22_g4101 [Coprinellus aureogranulatus]
MSLTKHVYQVNRKHRGGARKLSTSFSTIDPRKKVSPDFSEWPNRVRPEDVAIRKDSSKGLFLLVNIDRQEVKQGKDQGGSRKKKKTTEDAPRHAHLPIDAISYWRYGWLPLASRSPLKIGQIIGGLAICPDGPPRSLKLARESISVAVPHPRQKQICYSFIRLVPSDRTLLDEREHLQIRYPLFGGLRSTYKFLLAPPVSRFPPSYHPGTICVVGDSPSTISLPTTRKADAAGCSFRIQDTFTTCNHSLRLADQLDVAASCIFLATKTEECGRKLVDVARIYQTKVLNLSEPKQIPEDSQEVSERSAAILQTEEVLLEAICFDFFVESPHAELVDLFETCESPAPIQEFAWSLAHDSYRTPLCILYPPRIIATACYVLAQRIYDGPNSPSLDARISATSPASHLPTPPSHKPPSPDATRAVVERYAFNDNELVGIAGKCLSFTIQEECLNHGLLADALHIMLDFYSAQDESNFPYLSNIVCVPPPAKTTPRPQFYVPAHQINLPPPQPTNHGNTSPDDSLGRTPSSMHGGRSPDAVSQSQEQ